MSSHERGPTAEGEVFANATKTKGGGPVATLRRRLGADSLSLSIWLEPDGMETVDYRVRVTLPGDADPAPAIAAVSSAAYLHRQYVSTFKDGTMVELWGTAFVRSPVELADEILKNLELGGE